MNHDCFIVEDSMWIVTSPVNVPIYDFDFRRFFDCRTPYEVPPGKAAIARIGAFDDFQRFSDSCGEVGIKLTHTVKDHLLCTTLPQWYPLIEELTPRSRWYQKIPTLEEVLIDFDFPVFIKGERQTSKHSAVASIVRTPADYLKATSIFSEDPVLRWQEFVVRELKELRPVSGGHPDKVPASFEFRTFWWRGEYVGGGPYWFEANAYSWSDREEEEALQVATRAATLLDIPFLVIDLAQTLEGEWIVIECNDGMESGYAGVSPFRLWSNIIDIEAPS